MGAAQGELYLEPWSELDPAGPAGHAVEVVEGKLGAGRLGGFPLHRVFPGFLLF